MLAGISTYSDGWKKHTKPVIFCELDIKLVHQTGQHLKHTPTSHKLFPFIALGCDKLGCGCAIAAVEGFVFQDPDCIL